MTMIRETKNFAVLRDRRAFVLKVKHARSYPPQARISESDVMYLRSLPDGSFDAAAIWDFGVGVFGSK